jgi:predicted transcriptional regulator YdeE
MQKTTISIPEKKLVGLSIRTNNKDEFEPTKAKIMPLIQKYMEEDVANKTMHRINPGVMLCAYMDYESDENGEYTYFVGEEVEEFTKSSYIEVIIPKQKYCKFTTDNGQIPKIVIDSWIKIWQMSEKDFGGKRTYIADFEIYDQRASDMNNAALDIYIGIV